MGLLCLFAEKFRQALTRGTLAALKKFILESLLLGLEEGGGSTSDVAILSTVLVHRGRAWHELIDCVVAMLTLAELVGVLHLREIRLLG